MSRIARASASSDQEAAVVGGGVGLPINDVANAVPSTRTYEVQPGDTLSGIGEKFGVDWHQIAAANNIPPPYTLYPGQRLTIPR